MTPIDQRKHHVIITGTGHAVPTRVLSNLDLEQMVDTSDEWIRTRTGILCRRIADEHTATSDLATEAGRLALADAGVSPDELDLIIVATITPTCCSLRQAAWCRKPSGLGALHATICRQVVPV